MELVEDVLDFIEHLLMVKSASKTSVITDRHWQMMALANIVLPIKNHVLLNLYATQIHALKPNSYNLMAHARNALLTLDNTKICTVFLTNARKAKNCSLMELAKDAMIMK